MKKLFLLLAMLAVIVAFAQTDTLVVEDPSSIPDWVSWAINAILVAVSTWLAKAKLRLGKAVVLLQGLSDALMDGTVSKTEITSLIRQARELVEKEK